MLRNLTAAALLAVLAGSTLPATHALAQPVPVGTVFTYQGEARDAGGNLLTASSVNLRFRLYDRAGTTGQIQIGSQLARTVPMTNGKFTVSDLDFGAPAFSTDARFLEIDVQPVVNPLPAFVTITPRQRITPVPAAITASNALALEGNNASFYRNAANLTGAIPASVINGSSLVTNTTSNALTFTNASNAFTGVFTGNGAALTGLSAGSISSGTLSPARLPTNVAYLDIAQTFTAAKTIGAGTDLLFGDGASSIQFPTVAGTPDPMIFMFAGGASNADRMVLAHSPAFPTWGLQYRDASDKFVFVNAGSPQVTIDLSTGRFGIGTDTPGAGTQAGQAFDRFELVGPDVGLRVRNSNDQGGGILWNSFGTLHLGVYNPHATLAFGQVPALSRRAFFSMANDGRVGSTTNTGGSPIFRNLLDDGAGNFVVRTNGTLSPGAVASNHVALFENTGSTNADGIAIKIDNAACDRENNFVTFYNAGGAVCGRIEGYQTGDWLEPPPIPNLNFRANITLNPFNNWFNPGTLPTFNPGSFPTLNRGTFPTLNPGTLPVLSRTQDPIAPSLSWNTINLLGNDVIIPPINFNSGAPPIYGLSGGTLPSLNAGTLPSLSGGALPSLTGGTLPSITGSPITIGNPPMTLTLPTQQQINDLYCWGLTNETSHLIAVSLLTGPAGADLMLYGHIATDICRSGGVTYGSKGADYAEWLEKADPAEDIRSGMIVGVKSGKISRSVRDAEQIMVVSTNPIVLGNTPDPDKAANFKKVAFMGQVPTLVRGAVHAGDYIVVSNYNDGTGVAVAPSDLTPDHLDRMVGRAWEDSRDSFVNVVNVVVGVNHEATTRLFAAQSAQVASMKVENESLRSQLADLKAEQTRVAALLDRMQAVVDQRLADLNRPASPALAAGAR